VFYSQEENTQFYKHHEQEIVKIQARAKGFLTRKYIDQYRG